MELPDEDDDELLVVPRPSWSPAELRAWVRWVGPVRVLTGCGVVLVALGVAWWLLRPPELPTEAVIPRATTSVPPASQVPPADSTIAVATTGSPILVVHVAGAVAEPGVVVVPRGSRVVEAIAAAGGALDDAGVDALNLAARVTDGDRIEVPVRGTDAVLTVLHQRGGEAAAAGGGPVDLNRADAQQLETLPGVGAATAAAIVEHRERNGPFASVDELDDVSGIGPAKLAQLRELVTV